MSKIGRNAPCPCGSGVKYKRCCLEQDRLQAQTAANAEAAAAAALPQADASNPYTNIAASIEQLHAIISDKLEWSSPAYAELAHLLADEMKDRYKIGSTIEAISLWKEFANHTQPSFRKAGVYCAALEAFICEAHEIEHSRTELAAKYDVSASTVAKRYQELLAFTQEHFPEN